jgi:transposase
MDTSVKSDAGERSLGRATRRMRTLEEKQAIVEEASQPGASVAQVARKHAVNANLVFGWLRLHQRGVLHAQRHGKSVPLLPVKIATPTLTPSERASPLAQNTGARVEESAPESHAMLELVLQDGVRVRLYGEAQLTVLERILKQLSLP